MKNDCVCAFNKSCLQGQLVGRNTMPNSKAINMISYVLSRQKSFDELLTKLYIVASYYSYLFFWIAEEPNFNNMLTLVTSPFIAANISAEQPSSSRQSMSIPRRARILK
jgi:hypothetical protein